MDHDSNLIGAIKNGDADTVRSLLEAGVDPNACDCFLFRGYIDYVQPALVVAVRATDERGRRMEISENLPLVSALLEYGANVNCENTDGFTPIRLAAWNGWRETVRILLDHGADVNARDKQGQTPLMMAAARNHSELVKELLERGAEINLRATHGQTALMCAANRPHVDSLKVLLDWGADTDAKDDLGRTALNFLDYRKEMPKVMEAIELLDHSSGSKESRILTDL